MDSMTFLKGLSKMLQQMDDEEYIVKSNQYMKTIFTIDEGKGSHER